MGLKFFKLPEHRVFNYRPLYYNEREEALNKKIEEAEKKQKGEYIPGESIRGSFQKMRFDSKRSKVANPARRISALISLAFLMVMLYFFVKYIGLF
jgi:hypothetical protein